jgi:hypothetical protein
MTTWLPDASERFESYKRRVRVAVAGNPAVDPDEVLQDIQAHVDAELGASPGPVTLNALESVLQQLGSPTSWDADTTTGRRGEPSPGLGEQLRRFSARWETRLAGDWGSPFLLLIVTLAGLITIRFGGVILLALAYFMGRGLIRHTTPPLEGGRRTMALIPVGLGAAFMVGLAVMTPLLIMGRGPMSEGLTGLGAWWTLLGFAASREAPRVRAALYPFADWFEATHARLLMFIGVAVLVLAFLNEIA